MRDTILEPKPPPHDFVGRLDRDCETCGYPDRARWHTTKPRPTHEFAPDLAGNCLRCGGSRHSNPHLAATPISKPPPRHEALRLAREVMELVGPVPTITLTDAKYALYTLSQCVMRLAEECEALNRSKAEDSHGH